MDRDQHRIVNGITGVGPAGTVRRPPRPRTGGPLFQLAEGARTDAPAPLAGVGPPSLLSLQEEDTAAVQDRQARRHGRTVLDALTLLQRALLGGAGAGALQSLASLVRATPTPADPALAAAQRALLVRVAVELARGRVATT